MGSSTPETPARAAGAAAADTVEKHRQTAQSRRQGLALAMGLTGLAVAVLIALYSR
jgi:hypothetical protein